VMTTALLCGVLLGHTGLSDRRPAAVGILMLLVVLLPVNCLRDLVSTQLRLQLTSGLREQAFRDALTGLPNRGALTRRIAALDSSGPWVVLTLNLDGFKRVNDLLGTIAGDDLLVAVASQIQQGAGEGLAARIGGDEFAVLTPGDLDDGRRLAEALRVRVGAALAAGAPGLDTGLSVGVGNLVRREETSAASRDQLSALVESAAALRAAKARGWGCIEVYAGEVARAHERRIRLEARLARAIRDRAIRTYAQPVVRLDNNQVVGFEALARWDDEELGTVSPVEFIEMAEQTGMVVELGEQLLQSTMEEAARAGVFAAGLSVAVNASPIQLRVPGFVDAVRYEIARARIRPSQVVIEVTEAILVADDDPAMRALGELTLLGVGVAIDDFGTGYSALGYLRRLPVQVLKIDRSLTQSLLAEAKTVAIVEGVVAMAHRMGIRVVMEGIEDEIQADSCRALGADQGQGWLFGRPMPWADAAAVVAAAVETQRHRRPVPAWPDSCGDTWHTAHPRV
jgi:diguanylate cyclase (GGDEF)-like protein